MTTFTHHYLTANEKLIPIKDRLENILVDTERKILKKLDEVSVDVLISHQPSRVIPELGISGRYTKEARLIELTLDVDHEHLSSHLEEEVARTLSHEYMHAAREEYVSWEDGTFLDSLIAEGLTQSFETEVQPEIKPPIYATHLTEQEIKELWQKAKSILGEKDYDYEAWFFGNKDLKRWTGYSLGYWLVQNKMIKDECEASDLTQTPSADFRP